MVQLQVILSEAVKMHNVNTIATSLKVSVSRYLESPLTIYVKSWLFIVTQNFCFSKITMLVFPKQNPARFLRNNVKGPQALKQCSYLHYS